MHQYTRRPGETTLWPNAPRSVGSASDCQSTLAANVAAQEVFPPTRPPKEEPSRRAGGWERLASRAVHLRPKRIGTGRCCPQKRSLPRHPGQPVDRLLVSLLVADVAPLFKHMSLPTHVGGQRGSSGGIPAHPPPKRGAKPQGGRVGETNRLGAAQAAKALWERRAVPLAGRTGRRGSLPKPQGGLERVAWPAARPPLPSACRCRCTLAANVAA